MTKEEQRAIVATGIMKWAQTGPGHDNTRYWAIPNFHGGILKHICKVPDYHPDLEDDRSLGQMRDLKKRLRELRVQYQSGHSERAQQFWAMLYILGPRLKVLTGESKLSEGAALLKAASKLGMELAKEPDRDK